MNSVKKGKLILYPKTLITAQPTFNIAVHPVSREIYKISSSSQNDGLFKLDPISLTSNGKQRTDDPISSYLFPYIMTADTGDLLPIDHEWQKIFNVVEDRKVYDITTKTILGIGEFAYKAEQSRFYSLEISDSQSLKLTKSELETLRQILKGVKYKLNRIKR